MHLKHATAKRQQAAVLLTFLAIPFSGFLTDVYLPSFPSMAQNLQVSEKSIQLTLTCFFLSYGFSQLFVGSILDSVGRYKPVLISLIIVTISSLAITLTNDILLISILRIIQGICTSFIVVAKRAFFVDLFDAEKRKHYLSYFTIVWSCGPILAPFLGGYLEKLFSWQANFYFLAIYSVVLLVLELVVGGETIPAFKKFNLKKTALLYLVMLKNRGFVSGLVIIGFSYSVVMVFNIAGPFVIGEHYHFDSVVIGYCTLILGLSWMIGGILSKRLTPFRFQPKILFAASVQLALIFLLIALAVSMDSLYVLMMIAFLIHICSGFLFTNFFTYSMLFFPKNAGISGGLLGGSIYILTSLASFLISSSGSITDSTDMSIRYLMISGPMWLAIVFAVRFVYRR